MTVEELRNKGWIIYEGISGSRAYGTSMPTSDIDTRGVFIQSEDSILMNGFIEQISDDKNDIVFYELRRFFGLLAQNNPNIMELLNLPEDCIIYKSPVYDKLISQKDKIISKLCRQSFGGYATQQIKKARGRNKKINWEEKEMVRKGVLDFCYMMLEGGSLLLEDFFTARNHEDLGLAKVDHTHGIYAVYDLSLYDQKKGIVKNPETSNDVQVVSIPKGLASLGYMSFNKDAYSIHCKKYSEYKEWIENRNEDRYKMNKSHGKNYDSKNMSHCIRLLNTAIDIAVHKKIIIRRSEEELKQLMSIRRGEAEYDSLLEQAENLLTSMDNYFDTSNLPDKPNIEDLKLMQFEIRKKWYNSKK